MRCETSHRSTIHSDSQLYGSKCEKLWLMSKVDMSQIILRTTCTCPIQQVFPVLILLGLSTFAHIGDLKLFKDNGLLFLHQLLCLLVLTTAPSCFISWDERWGFRQCRCRYVSPPSPPCSSLLPPCHRHGDIATSPHQNGRCGNGSHSLVRTSCHPSSVVHSSKTSFLAIVYSTQH